MCRSKVRQCISNTECVFYAIATISIAAADETNVTNMCEDFRWMKSVNFLSWKCNGTKCDIIYDIGRCMSCDPSSCSVSSRGPVL